MSKNHRRKYLYSRNQKKEREKNSTQLNHHIVAEKKKGHFIGNHGAFQFIFSKTNLK